MIKIEISDITDLTEEELKNTSDYLLSFIEKNKTVINPLVASETKYSNIIENKYYITEEEISDKLDSLEMDASGTPWDSEVHVESKKKTLAGLWRLKRGTLNSQNKIETLLTSSENSQDDSKPITPVDFKLKGSVEPEPESEFKEFMFFITQVIRDKNLTPSEILNIVREHEIDSIPLVSSRVDLIPEITRKIKYHMTTKD